MALHLQVAGKRRKEARRAQYQEATYLEIQGRVAESVRAFRARKDWTQEEAAHQCRMSTRLFQQVEGASANLTLTTLARLCDGLGVDVTQLVRRRRVRSKKTSSAR